jgi:DNA helicase HerA-like ATPase
LTCDAWKYKVNGIPQGSFLLAFYNGESDVDEALLLRVIAPTKSPTDDDNIRSMVAYYKENIPIEGRAGGETESKLDEFTRYEFSFSAIECSILGVFYNVSVTDKNGENIRQTEFGADVENFYSANNYRVYKATDKVLQTIVNQRDDKNTIVGNPNEFEIGFVRYSSSRRFQHDLEKVPVWINSKDFLGKRTALFGMTRTGKSNSVKKIIQATTEISSKATNILTYDIERLKQLGAITEKDSLRELTAELTPPFEKDDAPRYPAGQIIFDINGEYANLNMQDKGTAIFEIYEELVTRYSIIDKEGFKVMKTNFYTDILGGFNFIQNELSKDDSNFIKDFLAIDLTPPDRDSDDSTKVRYERKIAAYKCCLHVAQFKTPIGESRITFTGRDELNKLYKEDGSVNPSKGISYYDATNWFLNIWQNYDSHEFFKKYKNSKGHEWADNDLKAILVMLSQKRKSGGSRDNGGFVKLRSLLEYHTETNSEDGFESEILNHLRRGKIVIVDLSQGSIKMQEVYSEKICTTLFRDSMNNFVKTYPNNFIQFYFEEAHNLFPQKENKNLSDIYNRIAKEGAKLNLGMLYATQEVSSISSNILKNTQNWFIAHLNNEDELKEIRKYYDFADFTDSLIRFSAKTDKGFVRMKTYTNPFVVPVQIGLFPNNK